MSLAGSATLPRPLERRRALLFEGSMDMNAYTIAEQLYSMAKNGEDGTIRVDGGALPTTGYYVGGKAPSFVVDSPADLDRGELGWWVGNNSATYYGVWVDSASSKVYIDAVTHMNDERFAVLLGRSRGELAIWDIANMREIDVCRNKD